MTTATLQYTIHVLMTTATLQYTIHVFNDYNNTAIHNTCVLLDKQKATVAHRQGKCHLHGCYVELVLIFWAHIYWYILGNE
jgi:hypothetical protein